jgi:predicted nucleic acid-binding protein
LRISKRYGFSIWEGLIVAAANQARCSTLLTEDLQHGQIIEGLRIENPFLEPSLH